MNPFEKEVVYKVKYEFHKWKKRLLIVDIVVIIIVLLLLGLFRPDYVVIAAFFLVILYLFLTQRKVLFYHLAVASAVALIWMLITKNEYGYNQNFLTVAGINLYTLFAVALSLFTVYVIYSHYEHILKAQGYVRKILLFIVFYVPLLILVETVAYHAFDIRNVATASYAGLPLCDCIHAPPWIQASYFLLGPIFFTIGFVLKLENPNFKIRKKTKKTFP